VQGNGGFNNRYEMGKDTWVYFDDIEPEADPKLYSEFYFVEQIFVARMISNSSQHQHTSM
jgi:hypothetical protein